jgi:hypothetical protein
MMRRAAGTAALLAAVVLAGCGKEPPAPKADAAKERAEALERAKQGAFGTSVQALEAAKGLGADLNQKALDAVDKAEKDAK